jgi:DNA ligase-4
MVSQPPYDKAWSIQHCFQLVSNNTVSVERKYDGEYCQIHVSKNEDEHHIKVLSKSGRDSTQDRVAIHDAIRKCLGIGTWQSKFDRQCILDGEIL